MKNKSPDKDKIKEAISDLSGRNVGAYGGSDAYNPELTEKKWEESKKAWRDSPQGRAAIRMFSRGILGAAFFMAGSLWARRLMHTGPTEILHEGEGKYDITKGIFEQKNFLQVIAKIIDTVVGKPIKFTVKLLTGSEELAERSVRFRPTKFNDSHRVLYNEAKAAGHALPLLYRGRSLGNEAVNVTFDFFCASIGDALGRDIADLFDPHVKKEWIKQGHVDIPSAAKHLVKSAWRYISYNGGEDWAVAIPYVYFMKGQRALINHFSPGFMYDFDRNLNGGSFRMGEGKEVAGNYTMPGILDLQTRFTVYNMGTLMYRESYDYLARKFQGKQAVLYGSPDKDTSHQTLGEKAGNLFKWGVRSIIKGGIYMTPAVPFFWITRSPQTKYRSLFIHPEHGMLCWKNDEKGGKDEALYASERNIAGKKNVYYARYAPYDSSGQWKGTENPFETLPHKSVGETNWLSAETHNPLYDGSFNPHHKVFNPIDRAVNAFGETNHYAMNHVTHMADAMEHQLDPYPGVKRVLKKSVGLYAEDRPGRENIYRPGTFTNILPPDKFSRFTEGFVNASASYTPYMYAKTEFAKLWDSGKMDLALERAIDGAASFNWGEFKAGVGETWRSFLRKPLKDEAREMEAQRRIKLDTTQVAGENRIARNGNGNGLQQRRPAGSSWRDFLVTGKPEEALETNANRNKSYAEKEELRNALKELTPPTNSIN